ncbi:MAG TPA: hypothetical protein VHX20_05315 [Terracidiphilus sp.]|jgi:hypothetical protein|nr:hypothetical protein [Terracidiphilus sp.]
MMNVSLPVSDAWQSDRIPYQGPLSSSLHVDPLRKVVLWSIAAYLVLNVGFELLRIPPVGPGVPAGELVLAACLCVMSMRVLLPLMAQEVWLLPIVMWWGLSFVRILADAKSGGIWAFRDGSQEIESLYLVVGFWLAGSATGLPYVFRWLRRLLVVGGCYGLLYPISNTLQKFSPKVSGLGTGATPLIFGMTTASQMMLWCAAWLLLERPRGSKMSRDIVAGLLVATAIAFGQSRSNYLQVLALGGVLLLVRRKAAAKWGLTLILGGVFIWLISVSGLNLKGREGHKISLDFVARHFESISGTGGGGASQESAAAGVPLRIGWWKHIATELKSSPEKMAFGLGFGMPLTDFEGRNAITREPHNSYISVVGRLGVSGLAMWTLMQFALYVSWWRSFSLCRRMNWTVDQVNLLLILVFAMITLIEAMGEAAMEAPYYAIPYYFLFGVMLRYSRHLKLAAKHEQSLLAQQDEDFDDGILDAEPA